MACGKYRKLPKTYLKQPKTTKKYNNNNPVENNVVFIVSNVM